MPLTLALIAPGAMGSAIAARLVHNGATVLTSLQGRGEASRKRAEAAGMIDASDDEILSRAEFILSIVPPADAVDLARRFLPKPGQKGPIFVDCNAISVETMKEIAGLFDMAGGEIVDGSIIGFPPKSVEDKCPLFYFAGPQASRLATLEAYGLRMKLIDGPIGASTALKLAYSGINKGLVALATTMILAAEREGAGLALLEEFKDSQPALFERLRFAVPDMFPKAYRWVEEMYAIKDFVGPDYPEKVIYDGAAAIFERMASADKGPAEVASVEAFFKRG
jgi:3-hydroxyisobutyrate dehydrogenase-like beta-hydroxyacid dehydrogenase